uniref:Uncharacterized protein n=1 Tax=Anguilla anguilla TaxID=7936 RepID=A0A0E9PA49_ANGAN
MMQSEEVILESASEDGQGFAVLLFAVCCQNRKEGLVPIRELVCRV